MAPTPIAQDSPLSDDFLADESVENASLQNRPCDRPNFGRPSSCSGEVARGGSQPSDPAADTAEEGVMRVEIHRTKFDDDGGRRRKIYPVEKHPSVFMDTLLDGLVNDDLDIGDDQFEDFTRQMDRVDTGSKRSDQSNFPERMMLLKLLIEGY